METEFNRESSIEPASSARLLSVIVPARNEAESIRACLASLVQQNEEDFSLGRDWELFVINDASTDDTRQIALEFPGVTVLEAPALPEGWTGKTNAVWFAAQQAQGKWLLFTDADTVHEAGDLRRSIHEAERHRVTLLSYSPRQVVHGLWQRALMPLIFAELAQKYPPRLVSLPDSPIAAANGQFLLVERAAYFRIGGHAAVHNAVLEDVELARRFKQTHEGLRFRYAPEAVSTRMYRSSGAMLEGWRKNLALLFPDALRRGVWKFLQAALLFGLPLLAIWFYLIVARVELIWAVALWWVWRVGVHYSRVSKSNFSVLDTLLSPLALPLFSWLLIDGWIRKNLRHQVTWKGRRYSI
jgi:glycosyltransferase involved in cell wall biosynthesis